MCAVLTEDKRTIVFMGSIYSLVLARIQIEFDICIFILHNVMHNNVYVM